MSKKENKTKQSEIKIKQYYTVKLEVTAPINITYKVYAEDPEQALDIVLKNSLQNINIPPQPILSQMKRLKGTVYAAGNSLIQLVKTLR